MIRRMFHTQEDWGKKLTSSIETVNVNAWLGYGHYFWYYEDDAIWWGITTKTRTGAYDVYCADIDTTNVLDTVFNEDHYKFWITNIEKAIQKFLKNERGNISLKYINEFFKDKGLLDGIDGVMFQDITDNPNYWIVKRFQYKKRIQIVVYNLKIVSNFAHHFGAAC